MKCDKTCNYNKDGECLVSAASQQGCFIQTDDVSDSAQTDCSVEELLENTPLLTKETIQAVADANKELNKQNVKA